MNPFRIFYFCSCSIRIFCVRRDAHWFRSVLVLMFFNLEQRGNLMGLGHTGGLNQDVVEQVPLGQGYDLLNQVVLQGAAEAAVLHGHHLVTTAAGSFLSYYSY